jgi:hypothetical protein
LQVRNGRQGVYFKERMRRGETIVSFPRNLRLDEKTAMKVSFVYKNVLDTIRSIKTVQILNICAGQSRSRFPASEARKVLS